MLKKKTLFGLSLLGLGTYSYYKYTTDNSFRSVCSLVYAGANMARVYKFTDDPIEVKNTNASIYLRDALRRNGGIYLKLGQLIATLDVIVPDEYRTIMSTLTRECQTAPYSEIEATIREDLGFPV